MTTARLVIGDALTFGLNRLSPGETADADTLATCLSALNAIADELNGLKSFLFREILTNSAAGISAATGTLGSTWTGLAPGDEILGATYNDGTIDLPMWPLTLQQYHEELPNKATPGTPVNWAHDGLATVYFSPVPTGQFVTLRTKQVVSDFADLDTDYSMPKGYRSGLAALLAEKLAPTMNPGALAAVRTIAQTARNRLHAQAINPAIIGARSSPYDIKRGW